MPRQAKLKVLLAHPISFKRRRFPPEVIQHAVWLYFRFTLSIRDVEELLAQRGIKVGPLIAATLRRFRAEAHQTRAAAAA